MIVNGVRMRVPGSFRGILPASRFRRRTVFEPHSYAGLKHSLSEGDAALDVGCSYGVLSALMGMMVGSGSCHSFDANKAVIPMAEQLAGANGLDGTVTVHNLAVSDAPGEVEFYAVPGRRSVASTRNPDIRRAEAGAVAQQVRATTIDEFCGARRLSPKCIKIDIEGGECAAVRGARGTIRRARPDLVIETHGPEIDGICGDLQELASTLESCGYGLYDMALGEEVSAGSYASSYAQKLGTVLATARPPDLESVRRDIELYRIRPSLPARLRRRLRP